MAYNDYSQYYQQPGMPGGAPGYSYDQTQQDYGSGTSGIGVPYKPVVPYNPLSNSGGGGGHRTLYVGCLDPSVTEQFLSTLFGTVGHVIGCKIIHSKSGDTYAFVEYGEHISAVTALTAMDGRSVLGQTIKVNWASNKDTKEEEAALNANIKKNYTGPRSDIFVGDLAPEIEFKELQAVFARFGPVCGCNIVRDPIRNKSKGYGFVSFVNNEDAERAIREMNGQLIGSRIVRTNWASRQNNDQAPCAETAFKAAAPKPRPLSADEVKRQTSPSNTSVYVGNLVKGSDQLIREKFSPYGIIKDLRLFVDKQFAFVIYDEHDAAVNAIVAMNGAEITEGYIKCGWGKEVPKNQRESNNREQSDYNNAPPHPSIGPMKPHQGSNNNRFSPYGSSNRSRGGGGSGGPQRGDYGGQSSAYGYGHDTNSSYGYGGGNDGGFSAGGYGGYGQDPSQGHQQYNDNNGGGGGGARGGPGGW